MLFVLICAQELKTIISIIQNVTCDIKWFSQETVMWRAEMTWRTLGKHNAVRSEKKQKNKLLPILSSKLLKECLLISWMLSLRAMAKSAKAHRWPHLSSHCFGRKRST